MKAHELAQILLDSCNPETEAVAYDADAQYTVPVTGILVGGGLVVIETDETEGNSQHGNRKHRSRH